MAQYDRTDLPDEHNGNFYVDEFGESLKNQDEVLPENGEQADGQSSEGEFTFYERTPDDFLEEAYPTDPAALASEENPYLTSSLNDNDLNDIWEEDQSA